MEQICSQTGLPENLSDESLIENGFYRVVDPLKNSWVFFNPPSTFSVDLESGVANILLLSKEKDLEEIKRRAIHLLLSESYKELRENLRDNEKIEDAIIVGLLGLPYEGSFFGELLRKADKVKDSIKRVNKAEDSFCVQKILADNELFNIPT